MLFRSKYILPHFDKYPLFSLKLKDYLVFKEIVILMEKGEHNTLAGLLKIFSLRAILNKGLPEIVKSEFPEINPATVPKFKISPILNPHWLSGFITAEESFFISLYPPLAKQAGFAAPSPFLLHSLCWLRSRKNYEGGRGMIKEKPDMQ